MLKVQLESGFFSALDPEIAQQDSREIDILEVTIAIMRPFFHVFSMLLESACHATLPSLCRSSLIWVGLKQLHFIAPWRIANSYGMSILTREFAGLPLKIVCCILHHYAILVYISAIFSLKFQETSPSTAFPRRHPSPFCLVSA